jgi:hypothetical protein
MLELGVTDDADVEEIENMLKKILSNLYDVGEIDEIRVTKKGEFVETEDVDVDEFSEMFDGVTSASIRKAIDVAKEFEEMSDKDT